MEELSTLQEVSRLIGFQQSLTFWQTHGFTQSLRGGGAHRRHITHSLDVGQILRSWDLGIEILHAWTNDEQDGNHHRDLQQKQLVTISNWW